VGLDNQNESNIPACSGPDPISTSPLLIYMDQTAPGLRLRFPPVAATGRPPPYARRPGLVGPPFAGEYHPSGMRYAHPFSSLPASVAKQSTQTLT